MRYSWRVTYSARNWNTKCNKLGMETQKKCAHPSCQCAARQGSDYCSTYCEGEAKTADILCNCGHPGCRDREPVAV